MAAALGGGAPIVGPFSNAEQGGGRLEAQRGGSSGSGVLASTLPGRGIKLKYTV